MRKLLLLLLVISSHTFAQTVAEARKAMNEKRYEDVKNISQPLAEGGDGDAQVNMGLLYLNGWGVDKNYSVSMQWLLLAANNENSSAQSILGTMYFRGDGVGVDLQKSFFWRKKAADNRHLSSAFDVGEMYMRGNGVVKNLLEAKKYYQQISNAKFINPPVYLQTRIDMARTRIVEIEKAFNVDSDAASLVLGQKVNSDTSPNSIAADKDNRDPQDTFKSIKALASKGEMNAQVQVGEMYESGIGVSQDSAEAIKWYKKAAIKGDSRGRQLLGAMYDTGRGVKQNYPEALKWYRLAAAQGNALAQYRLGQMYMEGVGVNQSSVEALKWLQLAAALGNGDSQLAIGEMYSFGKGVQQNYLEAATWFRMAADKGNSNAQYALGGLYRMGLGVVQDINEAIKWYQKAAAMGDSKSKAALDSIQVDIAAKQRVIDQQQRITREQDKRRQQAEESRREAAQNQQQMLERANLEKESCVSRANDKNCAWGCVDPKSQYFRLIPSCVERCESGKRAGVAACNGTYIPEAPQPQIIIQQSGGSLNPFPNANKCIKDGGTLMCM